MRFPLRLSADLTVGLAARTLRQKRNQQVILNLAPHGEFYVVPAKLNSPIVWIAGSEPLVHPEIAQVANALAAARRHVFLQTDGVLLRRRIHEFRPSPRLYLTIRLHGTEALHDAHVGRDGAFRLALEGIRAAQLSGFLLCAHLILHAGRGVNDLTRLQGQLRKLHLDGLLISPAVATNELKRAAAEVRRRLLTRRWAEFSGLLDSAILPTATHEPAPSRRKSLVQPPPAKCEEGAQAP